MLSQSLFVKRRLLAADGPAQEEEDGAGGEDVEAGRETQHRGHGKGAGDGPRPLHWAQSGDGEVNSPLQDRKERQNRQRDSSLAKGAKRWGGKGSRVKGGAELKEEDFVRRRKFFCRWAISAGLKAPLPALEVRGYHLGNVAR